MDEPGIHEQASKSQKPRWERAIEAAFCNAWEWGILYALIVISFGVTLWSWGNISSLEYITKNNLTIIQRYQVLVAVSVSTVVTTASYVLRWLYARRKQPNLRLGISFQQTNRWALVVLALPIVTALALHIETTQPLFTSFLLVMLTVILMIFFYRLLACWIPPDNEPFKPARRPKLAFAIVLISLLGYIGLIGAYALIDHHNLGTEIYDLGIYDNLVWQTAHGNFLDSTLLKSGNHTSAHFDPILGFLAIIYRFYMHAETLLVIQTLWLASGMIPLYLLAKRQLHNEWYAAVLVLVYALYPALHGVNMFDFHSLALIIPSAMWAIYLLDIGGFKRYWLALTLLLITREDISLLNCFIGAYAILIGRTRTGLATIAISLTYLIVIKIFVMPDTSLLMNSDKSYSYTHFYDEMIPHPQEGARGLVITLLTNPLYALQVVFKAEKLLFFFHLLLPLLALPLAARRKFILCIYGFIFIGLATRKHVYSLHFQYSALLFPMLFVAVPEGLIRIVNSPRSKALGLERGRLAWTLILGMLVAAIFTSLKYGVIIPNASFKAGWNRLVRHPTVEMKNRYTRVQELKTRLDPNAALSVASEVGPHFTNRGKIYLWPTIKDADYLVLGKTWFRENDEKILKSLIVRKQFRLVDEAYGISLYERVGHE